MYLKIEGQESPQFLFLARLSQVAFCLLTNIFNLLNLSLVMDKNKDILPELKNKGSG